jgi:hypothetical protein
MSRLSIALAFIAGTTILLAASNGAKPASAAAPVGEAYWRCPSGYAFETSGSAVHCKKAAWTETKPFLSCLLPTPDLKLDLVNQTDMCSGSIGMAVTAEPACYPQDIAAGFTKRHVSGKDFCGKNHPSEVIAPNQMISL